MGHAWLDSLSEDWVSQPGSDAAASGSATATTSHELTKPTSPDSKPPSSRIPRPRAPNSNPHAGLNGNSSGILSEWSSNEINAQSPPRRAPSKLSQEIKLERRGRYASRSVSASTSNSVVHNTVNHKSLSASPAKNRGHTPEWRRRLVKGDLSYGEQRDLFTSAGTGLEAMFKPPAENRTALADEEPEASEDSLPRQEDTLPSSPPLYLRDPSTVEIHVDLSLDEGNTMPPECDPNPPNQVRYRRTNEDSAEPSGDSDLSIAPHNSDRNNRNSLFSIPPTEKAVGVRQFSAHSETRNEDFSPVMLTYRQASNGRSSFGPAELPPDELRRRLEKLRQNQFVLGHEDADPLSKLGETTEDYEKLGGFINFRRGGRSTDGSFRNHVLSSGLNDTSELAPEESLQASTPKQFPSIRLEQWDDTPDQVASPSLPPVPFPSPEKKATQNLGSNGSPLKLFQPYDTFTNQTLLRRLSQFEADLTESSRSAMRQGPAPEVLDEDATQTELAQDEQRRSSHSIGHFGAGELDGYEFQDDFSYNSQDSSGFEDKENRGPDGQSIQLPRVPIFDVTNDSSPTEGEEIVVHRRRHISNSISSRRSLRTRQLDSRKHAGDESTAYDYGLLSTPQQDVAEGKRPRNSPAKDPTPKRRRTLHKSDIAYGVEDQTSALEPVQQSHLHMQSAIGKKRGEAHPAGLQPLVNPSVAATRQILRPRTPTPSQRSSVARERQPLAELGMSPGRQPGDALPVGASMDSERKPSIKTEDFINEANKIMAMIRNNAGLGSGLASLEESEVENGYGQDTDSSYQESTKEPFSRPPSREGRAPVARMSTRQEDPEILLRLKKYEEASDMGDLITSSVRSASMGQNIKPDLGAVHEGPEGARRVTSTTLPSIFDADEISDPPNLRVTRNPLAEQRSSDSLRDGFPSLASGGSSGSIPTGSSRGSDSRKVIAPESVEHLIGEQVGNMILDKDRNIWIKQKKQRPTSQRSNFLPSEGSEEDPFAGIPDLTVDMTMELQNLKRLAGQTESATLGSQPPASATAKPAVAMRGDYLGGLDSQIPSDTIEESHNTSFSPERANLSAQVEEEEDEVEHEIRIHEDRGTPKKRSLTISFSSPIASVIHDAVAGEANNTAVEESSLMEQSIGDISIESSNGGRARRRVSVTSITRNQRSASGARSGSQRPARHLSVKGQALLARPVSRIDEDDEETTTERLSGKKSRLNMELSVLGEDGTLVMDRTVGKEERRTSLSFVVQTPARPRDCPVPGADVAPVISQYVGTLSLSPMSEFTMHPEETLPLEASYIVGDHRLVTGERSKRVVSMTTRDLVDKLAGVEPFEPYWEDMRELALPQSRLESLHCLDDFCGQLESLDVSKNEIRNVSGIPSSVRHLKISHNQLSSLTAWNHLINLQFVDLSHNSLTSLSAFKSLVHLRELRVDYNQLTSLDGLKFHDGLQALYAKGNLIEAVDFDGAGLDRLCELDLRGNKIKSIENLDQLPMLTNLNLDNNGLSSLPLNADASVKYLKINNNMLTTLDLSHLPGLRLLHADRNHLSEIIGLSHARHLDTLSLREQCGEEPLGIEALLSRAYEVRKLFLSGNLLPSFDPPAAMLNLQLLEVANCGLAALPPRLGTFLPNLRVANFHYNALSDLRPLRGIPRLKRLAAAGNRLTSLGPVLEALAAFPQLASVDLRNNPVCQGFYPPTQVLVRPETSGGPAPDVFSLPDQDADRDRAYASRLDLDTRVRRRLYECLFVAYCRRLKKLDGVPLNRQIGRVRDAVWQALVTQGLVIESATASATDGLLLDKEFGFWGEESELACGDGADAASPEPEPEQVPIDESTRWEAENSFA